MDDKNKNEIAGQKENRFAPAEQARSLKTESIPVPERKEILRGEEIISKELKREIELMDVDENLKKLAEQKAQKIQFLADDEKLKNLLQIAREHGVLAAVQAAKKMNDPFLLDTLHDALAREGFYKEFVK